MDMFFLIFFILVIVIIFKSGLTREPAPCRHCGKEIKGTKQVVLGKNSNPFVLCPDCAKEVDLGLLSEAWSWTYEDYIRNIYPEYLYGNEKNHKKYTGNRKHSYGQYDSRDHSYEGDDFHNGTTNTEVQKALALYMFDSIDDLTLEELKKRRKKLIKTFHPDTGEEDKSYSQKINRAYDFLTEYCNRQTR